MMSYIDLQQFEAYFVGTELSNPKIGKKGKHERLMISDGTHLSHRGMLA